MSNSDASNAGIPLTETHQGDVLLKRHPNKSEDGTTGAVIETRLEPGGRVTSRIAHVACPGAVRDDGYYSSNSTPKGPGE